MRCTIGYFLFSFLPLVGCQQKENLPESPVANLNVPHFSSVVGESPSGPNYVPIALPTGKYPLLEKYRYRMDKELTAVEKEEVQELMRQIQNASRELAPYEAGIITAIFKSASWQEADMRVREKLAGVKGKFLAFKLEQFAAHTMLSIHLLQGAISPEKQEAIAFYTQVLLTNEHPDADLLSRSLSSLEGKWNKQQIVGAAKRTATYARKYLQESPCKPCVEKAGIPFERVEKLLDARDKKWYMISHSLPKLDELSQ